MSKSCHSQEAEEKLPVGIGPVAFAARIGVGQKPGKSARGPVAHRPVAHRLVARRLVAHRLVAQRVVGRRPVGHRPVDQRLLVAAHTPALCLGFADHKAAEAAQFGHTLATGHATD